MISQLREAPAESLLVGSMVTSDAGGRETAKTIIEGTPAGFRVLAGVLLQMADTVESEEEAGKGWGISLHPDDVPALRTLGVETVSLGCQSGLDLSGLEDG